MKNHDNRLKSIVQDLVSQYEEKERRIDNVKYRKLSDFDYILNYFLTEEPVRFPYFYCMAYTLNLLLTETRRMCPSLSDDDVSLVLEKAYMAYGAFPYLEGKHQARKASFKEKGSLAYFEQRAIIALYKFAARFFLYELIEKTIGMSIEEKVNEEQLLVNDHHEWETVVFALAKRAEIFKASGVNNDGFFESYVVAIAKQMEIITFLPWDLLRTLNDVVPAKLDKMPMQKRGQNLVTAKEAYLCADKFKAMMTG